MKGHKSNQSDRARFIAIGVFLGFVSGALLMSAFMSRWSSNQYSLTSMPVQGRAILHYATSKIIPQQTLEEVTESFNVLQTLSPCNFLIYGLGYDSLMWAGLNPNGTTLFLEESPEWVTTVLKDAPFLNAKTVPYRTQLRDADQILKTYKKNPDCQFSRAFLKGNQNCLLALENLPDEVYLREWDVIMVDAPRGYSPEHPGRMAAIFSAAVMARDRKRPGNTHVFLHDVDRPVEKKFAEEFLCSKYRVGAVGRLWHFEIPPSAPNNEGKTSFC
ncbi:probable methyltransferase At1g27930 [Chenopodium quinoa]|uniref:probable methyltransferase At1g27930 n=1 Tax=Chenopodium quinoa TaxID=63459 RepID=UPI000B79920F|nr:probable methyltransferase At1g27930 [Chenopodium quinoa]